MGTAIPLDPRRYGNVIARLQNHPEAVVRVAVQAEMNAEALEQQQAMYEGQLAALQQSKIGPNKRSSSKRPAPEPPTPPEPAK